MAPFLRNLHKKRVKTMANDIDWPKIGMSLDELARALRINTRTAQDLILRKGLPARKCGVQWRISPAAVEAWLASGNGASEENAATEK